MPVSDSWCTLCCLSADAIAHESELSPEPAKSKPSEEAAAAGPSAVEMCGPPTSKAHVKVPEGEGRLKIADEKHASETAAEVKVVVPAPLRPHPRVQPKHVAASLGLYACDKCITEITRNEIAAGEAASIF